MEIKKIAVLTSGGDAQGMNATINIIVRIANDRGIDVVGVVQGFYGLYNKFFVGLNPTNVNNIINEGGSILKTSRFDDFKRQDVVMQSVLNLKEENIDALIIIGGDGSIRGAQDLQKAGAKVIFIPGTIDNDLRYTKRSLGFDTAVNNACMYVENVLQTMKSLNRGVIFEVMGRNCGDITLFTGVATACDIVVVPEKPISEKELIEKVDFIIEKKNKVPSIIIAEHTFDSKKLAEKLSKHTKKEFKYSTVGYFQRGGAPTVEDRILAVSFAVRSIDLIEKGIFNKAIGWADDKVFEVDLDNALKADYDYNYDLLNIFYRLNYKKD